MKHLLIALAAFAALAAGAANIMGKDSRKFLENRRICVRRDTTTIPGSVISYYERNGKPDTKAAAVTTNELKRIVGREQYNPIQHENAVLVQTNAVLEVSAKKAWKVEKSAAKAKKKDQKTYESWVKDTKKAKSKASTEEMVAFFDSILEIIGEAD